MIHCSHRRREVTWMKCPYCGNPDTRVIDSRHIDEGASIRRRRVCDKCRRRFTTYEKIEETTLMVAIKYGSRELFDRNKVRNGIVTACKKRPVTTEQIDGLVDSIERRLIKMMKKEVTSVEIGEVILDSLSELDEVAYVRFASVYKQFDDVESFIREIEKLSRRVPDAD
jgi:transcriptional repressor NrdR